MESGRKEKGMDKRIQVLESEKEKLKEDLSELDQLKELLRIMRE